MKKKTQRTVFIEIQMIKNASIHAQALKQIRNDLFRLYTEIKISFLP